MSLLHLWIIPCIGPKHSFFLSFLYVIFCLNCSKLLIINSYSTVLLQSTAFLLGLIPSICILKFVFSCFVQPSNLLDHQGYDSTDAVEKERTSSILVVHITQSSPFPQDNLRNSIGLLNGKIQPFSFSNKKEDCSTRYKVA